MIKKTIVGIICASLCAALFAQGVALAKKRHEITIIAHRGDSGHAPENTLAAFRNATAKHADYFELDCRLTKDGAVVISHDGDLERTAGKKADIADLTLEQVEAVEVGGWFAPEFKGEKVPTFAQALEAATKDCGVYVEIKGERGDGEASKALIERAKGLTALAKEVRREMLNAVNNAPTRSPELTRACIAEIRAHKMQKRVVIQSFSPLICFVALCEAPEIRTELLISDDKDDAAHFQRLADFGMVIGVKGFNASKDSLTPERLAAFHAAKKTVAVWTLNEPAEWEQFAAMGVDAIITNFPEECSMKVREAR